MSRESEIITECKKRYDHVTIGLLMKTGGTWRSIKAADWSETGFNFFFDQVLKEKIIIFRKGAEEFSGTVVWTCQSKDDDFKLEMLLNKLIFEHIKQLASDKATAQRIIRLCRTHGRIEEKKKLLSMVNDRLITDESLSQLLQKENPQNRLYRYGVQVDSPTWIAIVQTTLDATQIVLELEKIVKKS
ncbi:MAG: hypothetical protein WC539_09050 [Nitrospirota bacterium]